MNRPGPPLFGNFSDKCVSCGVLWPSVRFTSMCPILATVVRWLVPFVLPLMLWSASVRAGETAPAASTAPPAKASAPSKMPAARPVFVLMVDTTSAFEQADALSVALRREMAKTEGYRVEEGNLALGVVRTALGCPMPIDGACEQRIAQELKVDRFVWAYLELHDNIVQGALHFFQGSGASVAVPLKYSKNLTEAADEALIAIAQDALKKAGAGPAKGTLRIDAPGIAGDVYLDDQKVAVLKGGSARWDAPSGAHRVRIRTTDELELASDVRIPPWSEVLVRFSRPPKLETHLDPKIPIGFGFLAAGVGFGIGGLVSTVNVLDDQSTFDERYKSTFAGVSDTCDLDPGELTPGLIRLCNHAEKHVTLQAVFYPIAIALVGAGSTFLALSDWSGRPTQVALTPWGGPGLAGVSVRSRY